MTVPAEVLLGFVEQTGASLQYIFTGEGSRYQRSGAEPLPSDLSPVDLIRQGLERLERESGGGPGGVPADHVPIRIFPLAQLAGIDGNGSAPVGEVLALRAWLANPARTVAVTVDDDAMQPVLPEGSLAVVDRSAVDPRILNGQIVAACPEGIPMLRWLEINGRHMILRPNQVGREHPLIPLEPDVKGRTPIIGRVVCSWNRFGQA